MSRRGAAWRFVRTVAAEVHENNVTLMAASVAYHAFISLLPLLVFLIFALSLLDNQTLTANLVEFTDSVLTPHAQLVLAESLTDEQARARVSVLGAATLVWGMFKIFRGLNVTFADLYGTDVEESLVTQLREGLIVGFALTVAVTVVIAAGAAFALFPDVPYSRFINPVFLVAGLAVAFFPIYYVFPDVDLSLRSVIPGVVLAAAGWAGLQVLFQTYVTYTIRFEAYGALGSALLVVVWLYFSSLVLLLGAVVNAVLARQEGGFAVESANPSARNSDATADSNVAADPNAARDSDAPADPERLARAHEELGRAYERLDAENRRLRERIAEIDGENERLTREHAELARRLKRRRWPVWVRAKRWLLGRRE